MSQISQLFDFSMIQLFALKRDKTDERLIYFHLYAVKRSETELITCCFIMRSCPLQCI